MDFDLLASRFEVRSEVQSSKFGSIEGSKKLGSVRSRFDKEEVRPPLLFPPIEN